MTRPFCPHCGCDISIDQPVIINDFSMMSSSAQFLYRGNPIKLTPAERSICWSLMKAFPEPVKLDVLLERMDSDGEYNTVSVLVHRIRKKLAEAGANDPIVPDRSYGKRAYRWDARKRTKK